MFYQTTQIKASFSAIEGSRNIEDLKGMTEPVCTATPMPGVHEVRILQLLTCGLRTITNLDEKICPGSTLHTVLASAYSYIYQVHVALCADIFTHIAPTIALCLGGKYKAMLGALCLCGRCSSDCTVSASTLERSTLFLGDLSLLR